VSSTLTNLVLIYESVSSATALNEDCLTNESFRVKVKIMLRPTVSPLCTAPYIVQRISMEIVGCLSVSVETFVESSFTRNVLTEPLPSNGLFRIRCSGNVRCTSRWLAVDFRSVSTIPALSRCLSNLCLAMVIFVTMCSSCSIPRNNIAATGNLYTILV
jgi:hypothetical protein